MSESPSDKWTRIGFLQTDQPADEIALQRTVHLCQQTHADLSVIGCLEEPPEGILQLISSLTGHADSASDEKDLEELLFRNQALAEENQVATVTHLLKGSTLRNVVCQSVDEQLNLLIKAAQPSVGIRRVLFGHLDRQLVRKCPCPIWIEKPSSRPSHDRILAAVDPAPFASERQYDATRNLLNISILRMATVLAELEKAELHVVHVWPFFQEQRLHSRGGYSDSEVAGIGSSIRRQHEAALSELIEPFLPKIQKVHLLKGNAAEEISRLAANQSFDAVVMGTVCRSGVQGLLIGNTAETLLDQVDCSIVAIKPPGFVSPVSASSGS